MNCRKIDHWFFSGFIVDRTLSPGRVQYLRGLFMNQFFKNIIFLIVALVLFFPSLCLSADFIVGKIVEHSPDKELIQIADTVYKVGYVYQDDGVNPVTLSFRKNLKEGSIVQIYPGEKTVDYYIALKVILLTGVKEQQMLAEFGVEYDPRGIRQEKQRQERERQGKSK